MSKRHTQVHLRPSVLARSVAHSSVGWLPPSNRLLANHHPPSTQIDLAFIPKQNTQLVHQTKNNKNNKSSHKCFLVHTRKEKLIHARAVFTNYPDHPRPQYGHSASSRSKPNNHTTIPTMFDNPVLWYSSPHCLVHG